MGVNVDHVATVRQARRTVEPDPVWAAALAELGGADAIVVHLREDRRHIQDRDLRILRQTVKVELNLEMGMSEEIVGIAHEVKPDRVTLVPEKRQELTTEGGLNVVQNFDRVRQVVKGMQERGIRVSLFIDPDREQLKASKKSGAAIVELHTGLYANATTFEQRVKEMEKVAEAARIGRELGLAVAAGHGLTYSNVQGIAAIEELFELNIGHSIVSRAVLVGMERAVREMKEIMERGRKS